MNCGLFFMNEKWANQLLMSFYAFWIVSEAVQIHIPIPPDRFANLVVYQYYLIKIYLVSR